MKHHARSDLWPVVALANHGEEALTDLTQIVEPVLQMVSEQRILESTKPGNSIHLASLTESDVSNMHQLIELTKPGPFFPATVSIARHIGIRQQGQLIAMAGERLALTNYHEISTVCTHPDYQGKGYSRLLVRATLSIPIGMMKLFHSCMSTLTTNGRFVCMKLCISAVAVNYNWQYCAGNNDY
jgi:hypothetical protein